MRASTAGLLLGLLDKYILMWNSGLSISVATVVEPPVNPSKEITFEFPEMEYLCSVQPRSLHDVKKQLAMLECPLLHI